MKIFLAILGCAAFVLGVVGIFVPLLPTTPFLLLAAALWVRSSPRLYEWLLAHRCFGGYIRNFRENRAIPLRAKVVSIALMWGTMLYCIFGLLDGWWWAQVGLLAVAVGVTWHIVTPHRLDRRPAETRCALTFGRETHQESQCIANEIKTNLTENFDPDLFGL